MFCFASRFLTATQHFPAQSRGKTPRGQIQAFSFRFQVNVCDTTALFGLAEMGYNPGAASMGLDTHETNPMGGSGIPG